MFYSLNNSSDDAGSMTDTAEFVQLIIVASFAAAIAKDVAIARKPSVLRRTPGVALQNRTCRVAPL
jgi:hypothetical protein